jgi:hypothetical protein
MIDILPLELCGLNGFGASKGHLFILNTKKTAVKESGRKKQAKRIAHGGCAFTTDN